MKILNVRGVLKTCTTTGNKTWAGFIDEGVAVPDGLVESPVDVLAADDGNFYVLAFVDPIPHLDASAVVEVSATETRRKAMAKLTDEELEALGFKREE